ncbi:serine/threonine-protein kinase PLK1-like [Convolutriloba macropyga]|uniref:serine/threonine-protein kinase PLK1-like n=1 Tax=Convolutriloba macropyga TaxID=536237 RepID=UPI003F51F970
MSSKDRFPDIPIPEEIKDPLTKTSYIKGRFLGKGGFAKCFELTDKTTGQIYAGKIVPKQLLVKPQQKDKMKMEIALHGRMDHSHIVKFYSHFEDNDFIYIVLELCKRRSLMELHKRRKSITEEEARYFIYQILLAVSYIHEKGVVHRDLKLGNLFLNDQIQVKIGDFGLATRIESPQDRRKTICGTPNYIAPEVLQKKGHSYEVDIWAIGCILYTLLVGKPPFETQTLNDTYERIKANDYHIPHKLGNEAASLIRKLLSADPNKRPKVRDIMVDPFMTCGFLPKVLPSSCLNMTPRLNNLHTNAGSHNSEEDHMKRRALQNVNGSDNINQLSRNPKSRIGSSVNDLNVQRPKTVASSHLKSAGVNRSAEEVIDVTQVPPLKHLQDLKAMMLYIDKVSDHQFVSKLNEDLESPDLIPIYWVSKWVDYSDKYGLSYQLCDGSVGVLFNDNSRMVLFQDEDNIQFIDHRHKESFHSMTDYPPELKKKITLLKYFRSYMSEHLLKTGGDVERPADDVIQGRLPFLRTWFRTKNAIVLFLSNGTIQINFFQCHSKLILCPVMQAISYIDEEKNFRTFSASAFRTGVITKHLQSRLKYALLMIDKLAHNLPSSSGNLPTYHHRPPTSQTKVTTDR